jgi:hypothetical protein
MILVAILVILVILFFAFEVLFGKRLAYIRIPQLVELLFHRPVAQEGAAIHGGEEGAFARIFSDVTLNTLVAILVSLALLAASLWVILSGNYDAGTQKWAYGIAGSMIGYWVIPSQKSSHRRKKKG